MLARTTMIAAVCLTFGAGALVSGCLACNDIGCAGGLQWTATAEDDSPLPPGAYRFELTLESTAYVAECTVGETVGDSTCGDVTRADGEQDFSVTLSLAHLDPDEWDPDAAAGGFYLMAVDSSGSSPDGSYSEHRGPESVGLVVLRDGEPFLQDAFEIEYARDEAYRGDDRCGFCDEQELRASTWPAAEASE
ncbi:MAG: hypothetical protein AAF721_24660 [Myxococcota bacterium]